MRVIVLEGKASSGLVTQEKWPSQCSAPFGLKKPGGQRLQARAPEPGKFCVRAHGAFASAWGGHGRVWGICSANTASWLSRQKEFLEKPQSLSCPSRRVLPCLVHEGAGSRSQQTRGDAQGGYRVQESCLGFGHPAHGHGGEGYPRCLSAHSLPPAEVQANPRRDLRPGRVGVGVQISSPRQGGLACQRALCFVGRRAGRKEAALFVCLWRTSLCALESPLDSGGQAGSLGRDCFCFIVQIRARVLKPPKDTALGAENAGDTLTEGKNATLSKNAVQVNSRDA